MSINHYSSDHWWSHYVMDSSARTSSSNQKPTFISNNSTHFVPNSTATFWLAPDHHQAGGEAMVCGKNSAFGFNLNNEDEEELQSTADDGENCNNSTSRELEQDQEEEIPREPLFEKPLTPSDVGKLNRLVIPKQHAEKHFPLNNGGGGGESGENGLLLSFEDEVGKSWRFRYSYWNSSQSYVLTKGWSRFVKEKRLDAGDIVVFLRHRVDAGRLFIGWRRRNSGGGQDSGGVAPPTATVGPGGGGWSRVYYSGRPYHQGPSSLPYQLPDQCLHAGSSVSPNQTTSGNSKRLRLFGVNLECQADDSEPSTPVGSPMSSQGQAHQHPYHQYYSNHMDIGFSGADVHRQG
ncbi:hypothetical protein CDL12_10689 [Handroanthus impetiginosus]|uniref:TF-B3 domain-containing protein n=1 Tax=Handroanthus impetiginosus TaxID=429701 RepID=A0A2G9HGL2_9LAMI|nr:hypothetical protein CDL12_10689 [Handroanthus impetiginosus]